MSGMLTFLAQYIDDRDPFDSSNVRSPTKPVAFSFRWNISIAQQLTSLHHVLNAPHKLEDCTIQLYQGTKSGPYLDIESSFNEQSKEVLDFYNGAKSIFILRSQPKCRALAIISKFVNFYAIYQKDQLKRESELCDNSNEILKRKLIRLKHIVLDDHDFIHDFVENDGFRCLINIGDAYTDCRIRIIRAMSEMIYYVDGMKGFIDHQEAVNWLYSILETTEPVVLSMSFKLLIIFVEYSASNASMFIDIVHLIDRHDGKTPFYRLIEILRIQRNPEIPYLCMALINRTIAAIPDQDTFFDVVDWLECQGMQKIVERLKNEYQIFIKDPKPISSSSVRSNGRTEEAARNLLIQLEVYETVLCLEDGDGIPEQTEQQIRELIGLTKDRQKSATPRISLRRQTMTGSMMDLSIQSDSVEPRNQSKIERRLSSNTSEKKSLDRWASDSCEKRATLPPAPPSASRQCNQYKNLKSRWETSISQQAIKTHVKSYMNNEAAKKSTDLARDAIMNASRFRMDSNQEQPLITVARQPKTFSATNEAAYSTEQKNGLVKVDVKVGDREKGRVNRAKDSFTKQQLYSSSCFDSDLNKISNHQQQQNGVQMVMTPVDTTQSKSPITLYNYTFSDTDDETVSSPPLLGNKPPCAPPSFAPPPPTMLPPTAPSSATLSDIKANKLKSSQSSNNQSDNQRKTIRLHWREVVAQQPAYLLTSKINSKGKTLWQSIPNVHIDTNKIQEKFELKQGLISYKKSSESKKELTILDTKRSNAINIGLKFLPDLNTIKESILKMDTTHIKKDGIEKLISLAFSDEEIVKIREAHSDNKDIPLGKAEKFLLELSEIDHLKERLEFWLFGSDFKNFVVELLDPLQDLQIAMRQIYNSKTFKQIIGTLLAIGNSLNESEIKSFHFEYLCKVAEVRDNDRATLLYHAASFVEEHFQNFTDLHDEISTIARCARVDYEDLEEKLKKLDSDCKKCNLYLPVIGKNRDSKMCPRGPTDFLRTCEIEIKALQEIHQRVMKKFRKFCAWLGLTLSQISSVNVHSVCKIIADFALEHKTTRGEIAQDREKRNNREQRNRNRGKTIERTFNSKSKFKNGPFTFNDKNDELTECLRQSGSTYRRHRGRDSSNSRKASGETDTDVATDGHEEFIDAIVEKAALPDLEPRHRTSTKVPDRKSFRRAKPPIFDDERIRMPSSNKNEPIRNFTCLR